MPQDGGNVGIGALGKFDQPVLDLDIIMRPRHRQAGGGFECPAAMIVKPSNQRFEIDGNHVVSLFPWPANIFCVFERVERNFRGTRSY
jgi:hypothetical protein